jgi:hypothetical protein
MKDLSKKGCLPFWRCTMMYFFPSIVTARLILWRYIKKFVCMIFNHTRKLEGACIFTNKSQPIPKKRCTICHVRFQVLTAASMMFRAVFWDILPCKMIVDHFTRQYGSITQKTALNIIRKNKLQGNIRSHLNYRRKCLSGGNVIDSRWAQAVNETLAHIQRYSNSEMVTLFIEASSGWNL